MNIKLRPIDQQVVVITGASSGIGRASALLAATKGARVVVSSRNEPALAALVEEITQAGGDAAYAVADVADRTQVQGIADVAIARYGRIDTWVNDAGVGLFGKLEDVSESDHRKLFETNFWGVVNGSLVALPYLKKNGGALVNLGSVASDMVIPFQAMYSVTKHAIKGYTDGLRMELDEEKSPVSVTLVKPAAIATPFEQHARNYLDREPKLPPPIYDPEDVAMAIVHAAQHPERDIYVGGVGKQMSNTGLRRPHVADWLGTNVFTRLQFRDEPARPRHDNLHEPGIDGSVRGNVGDRIVMSATYTRAVLHPVVTGALVMLVGAVAAAVVKSVTSV